MMLRRERDNSRGLGIGQRIGKNDHCIGVLGCGRRKGDIEFLDRSRLDYLQSQAQVPGYPGHLLGYYQPDVGQMRPPIRGRLT